MSNRPARQYRVTHICQVFGISRAQLRRYQRQQWVELFVADDGQEWMSRQQTGRLWRIVSLQRDLGVNLAGIEVCLRMQEQMEQMRGQVEDILAYAQRRLDDRVATLRQRLETLAAQGRLHLPDVLDADEPE